MYDIWIRLLILSNTKIFDVCHVLDFHFIDRYVFHISVIVQINSDRKQTKLNQQNLGVMTRYILGI